MFENVIRWLVKRYKYNNREYLIGFNIFIFLYVCVSKQMKMIEDEKLEKFI